MEGKVISFINMKGGVGKTTLSLGVPRKQKKRILKIYSIREIKNMIC